MVALSHVDDVTSMIAAAVGNEKAFKQVLYYFIDELFITSITNISLLKDQLFITHYFTDLKTKSRNLNEEFKIPLNYC